MCLVVPKAGVGWVERAPAIRVPQHKPRASPHLPSLVLSCFPTAPPTRLNTIRSRVEKDKGSILLEAQSHLPLGALGPDFQCSSPSFDHQLQHNFLPDVLMT